MKKLEVGTEMCIKYYDRWEQEYSYGFSKVVKMTAKRATLENGKVLNLEPNTSNQGEIYFKTFGDGRDYQYWFFATPEIHAKQKAYEEKKKVCLWFDAKKFTAEDKAAIYKQFEQLGKL